MSYTKLNVVDAKKFQKEFLKVYTYSENSDYVRIRKLEDLEKCKCLYKKGVGFVAVESDGNIVAILKDGSDNFIRTAVLNAMEYGGCKLDCIGDKLTDMYIQLGFIPVCKLRRCDMYLESDEVLQDKEGYFLMLWDNLSVENIDFYYGCYSSLKEGYNNLPYVTSYEEGYKLRDKKINEFKERG